MATDPSDMGQVLKQLRVISKILLVTNVDQIERALSVIASTDDRKRAWVLFDGTRNSADVAKILKKSERGVQLFVVAAIEAGFMEANSRKPPTRTIDFIPTGWSALVEPLLTAEPVAPAVPAAPTPSQKTLPEAPREEVNPNA